MTAVTSDLCQCAVRCLCGLDDRKRIIFHAHTSLDAVVQAAKTVDASAAHAARLGTGHGVPQIYPPHHGWHTRSPLAAATLFCHISSLCVATPPAHCRTAGDPFCRHAWNPTILWRANACATGWAFFLGLLWVYITAPLAALSLLAHTHFTKPGEILETSHGSSDCCSSSCHKEIPSAFCYQNMLCECRYAGFGVGLPSWLL